MYQFSRAIYRELAPYIDQPQTGSSDVDTHVEVLHACEAAIERLATDRHHFARPTRTLFGDLRPYFPMNAQSRLYHVVSTYLGYAEQYVDQHPFAGSDLSGAPMQCRATTRKGTPCQRMPLPHNGYCPSHQHLADTEELEAALAA
jgi:hypothetical protein